MKLYCLVALVLLATGCSTSGSRTSEGSPGEAPSEEEYTHTQNIYFLQHRLISNWVFESDGEFFFDIYNGNVGQFMEVAADVVSQDYADDIEIKPLVGRDAVLIVFPEPEVSPHCYYALIKKTGDDYAYYTYEKTFQMEGQDAAGVVGGWGEDGSRMNFGSRNYRTAEAFVQDMMGE